MKHIAHLVWIALLLTCCAGCPADKQTSVKLVIVGDEDLVSELVADVFRHLVDNPDTYAASSSRWLDGPTTLTVSPVRNIERFRSCLLFGSITKQEGRTIHLTLDPAKTRAWIAISRTVTFVKEFPLFVRWELKMLQYRVKAWFSGRSVSTEVWEAILFEREF